MIETVLISIACTWIPMVIIGAISYGSLRAQGDSNTKRINKMESADLLSIPAHKVLQDACQLQLQTEILHLKGDVKELKQDVKELKTIVLSGEAKRDNTRDELRDVLLELNKTIVRYGHKE